MIRRTIILIIFLIVITFAGYSCGGGYSSLLDEGNSLARSADAIYVEYNICTKIETCSSQEVVFVAQNAKGLEISFYGVESRALQARLLSLCTDSMVNTMKAKSLQVEIHKKPRRTEKGAGTFPAGIPDFTMKLEKNDANR